MKFKEKGTFEINEVAGLKTIPCSTCKDNELSDFRRRHPMFPTIE